MGRRRRRRRACLGGVRVDYARGSGHDAGCHRVLRVTAADFCRIDHVCRHRGRRTRARRVCVDAHLGWEHFCRRKIDARAKRHARFATLARRRVEHAHG